MDYELGEQRRLTFVAQDHEDVIIVGVGGGRLGRVVARLLAPPAHLILAGWFGLRRLVRSRRDRAV